MSKYRLQRIDTATWLPMADVTGATAITVKSDSNYDGGSPLMMSGDVSIDGKIYEGYYRISEQDGSEQVTIATLLLIPDSSEWSCGSWESSVTGKSVLTQASETYFAPGAYCPQGTDGAAWAGALLRANIPAPVVVRGSFNLSEHIVFDLGASYLDGIWQVLDVGNFTMQIAGDGTVTICPRPTEPALTINTSNRGLLTSEISQGLPLEGIPNVVRVYVNGEEYVASNDDPTSPTSTASRGRRIEHIEEDPTMKEGESPLQYAMRQLKELGEVYETYDVTREYIEGVNVNSLIRANLPEQDMDGDFISLSQSIECEGSIEVQETWGRLV